MSEQSRVGHPKELLLPTDISGFDSVAELSLDMRWSWNHATDQVWRQLDPVLWELTHNPWGILQTVSREKLQRVLSDPAFRKNLDDLVHARRDAAEALAWFQQANPQSQLGSVAYFSMEFMLSEALPIYSGGLGNVAGDQLKAASDLGVPVIGVGLLYQQGYFRQVLDKDGAQHLFEVQVYLDELDPEMVRVELYANGAEGGAPERLEMARMRQLVGASNGFAYRAEVPTARPTTDYTVRLIPYYDGVAVPLEDAHILWQR